MPGGLRFRCRRSLRLGGLGRRSGDAERGFGLRVPVWIMCWRKHGHAPIRASAVPGEMAGINVPLSGWILSQMAHDVESTQVQAFPDEPDMRRTPAMERGVFRLFAYFLAALSRPFAGDPALALYATPSPGGEGAADVLRNTDGASWFKKSRIPVSLIVGWGVNNSTKVLLAVASLPISLW